MVEPPSIVVQPPTALHLVLFTLAEERALKLVVFRRPVLFLALERERFRVSRPNDECTSIDVPLASSSTYTCTSRNAGSGDGSSPPNDRTGHKLG